MPFNLGKIIDIAEKVTGVDIDGDGRIGKSKHKKKHKMGKLPNFTEPMAWLPAQRIQQSQLHYRGGVNPICPYRTAQPYTGGRVRGLFIGINYFGQSGELKGCINDVTMILGTLEKIKFPLQEACILVDDPNFKGCSGPPTRANIIHHMQWLVHGARPGDVFFLHYSGHGSQTRDTDGDEEDGYDETLVPVDYKTAGTIVDDDIFLLLVRPLPPGARMTAIMDCCHSGTLMDLPFEFVANAHMGQGSNFKMQACSKVADFHRMGDVVLFSGCSDKQTSADVGNTASFGNQNAHGRGCAGGACTNALAAVLTTTSGLTYVQLLDHMRRNLAQRGYSQIPQLSSSKPIDLNKPFSLFGSLQQGAYVPMGGHAYPQHGYPPQGYPPQGYPPQQYPPQGYPPQQYPPQGYPPQQAYPQQGYPPQPYR